MKNFCWKIPSNQSIDQINGDKKERKKKKFSHSFPRNKMHENFPFIPLHSINLDRYAFNVQKFFLFFFVPDTIGFEWNSFHFSAIWFLFWFFVWFTFIIIMTTFIESIDLFISENNRFFFMLIKNEKKKIFSFYYDWSLCVYQG